MYRRKGPGLCMAIVLILLTLPLAWLQPLAHAQPASRAQGCWSVMPIPNIQGRSAQIKSISASSPTDVWVVGNTDVPDNPHPFAMRWNGVEWAMLPAPGITRTFRVESIKAFSPGEAWMVGSVIASPAMASIPAVARWDGHAWNIVPNPLDFPALHYLNHIDGTSGSDLWAVGTSYSGPHNAIATSILLHWDGTAWSSHSVLGQDPDTGLNRVAVVSSNDVWAIGTGILHWNGTAWSNALRDYVRPGREMRGALAQSDGTVLAVGSDGTRPAFARWNGTAWLTGTVPLADEASVLNAAAVLPIGEVWAAGRHVSQALFMRWDGTKWTPIPNPVPGFRSEIVDMAAVGDEIWAVGWRTMTAASPQGDPWPSEALVMRYTTAPCPGALPTVPLNPPVPLPGGGGVTFPQTGQTVSGTFYNYWQNHGGLPQQGYPISGVIGETSATDGKTYTAQYFERAVFEFHPENRGTPYEVLLAHLGTFQYRQKYPGGAPNQRPNTDPGTVTFPETGKRLGGAFLQYWREHGDLMQQGFPISDEFTEVSPLDGRPYTVQYFERAVFEWHPENAPPNNVLLSHLGRFRYQEKYEGKNAQGPAPRQIAASVMPGSLRGGGHYLVWQDMRQGGYASQVVYAYDAAQNREMPISASMTEHGLPLVTNGVMALWSPRNIDQLYISGYEFATGGAPRIDPPQTNSSPDFRRSDIAFSGRTLYYTDNWQDHTGLFKLDIRVQVERKLYDVAPMPGSLRAADVEGLALWTEQRAVGSQVERLLRVYRDDTNTTQTLNSGFGAYSGYAAAYTPSTGNRVVYSFYSRIADQTTYLHDLRSGTRTVIARGAASGPTIKGDQAAWVRWPSGPGETGGWRIEVYDTRNGSVTTVLSSFPAMPHDLSLLENGKLAFTADTDLYAPGEELYLLDLDARP